MTIASPQRKTTNSKGSSNEITTRRANVKLPPIPESNSTRRLRKQNRRIVESIRGNF